MNPDLSTLSTGAIVAIGVLIAVQLTLWVVAVVVLVRTPRDRLGFGRKWPWLLIIVLVNLVGPIVFLAAGRRPVPAGNEPATEPRSDPAHTVRTLYGDDRE